MGIVYLTDAADGKKQGVDDYLAAGEGTVGDLETMAEDRASREFVDAQERVAGISVCRASAGHVVRGG